MASSEYEQKFDTDETSKLDTFGLPRIIIPNSDTPLAQRNQSARTVVQARNVPLRVLVRVHGEGGSAFLAFDVASLQNPKQLAQTFEIEAGEKDVFVVMPGQILSACSRSNGISISVAISPAPVLSD